MLLIIDNYDSFTYNLVQYFAELGQEIRVARNDQITLPQIIQLDPQGIVISPGPCGPEAAGVSLLLIEQLKGKIPILGVCLGHQCIVHALGGKIIGAKTIMHGKTSLIYHHGKGVFKNLPSPFRATRYHSLAADLKTLPKTLEITAWTQTEAGEIEEIMGISQAEMGLEGVQFHPESILTEHGHALLKNFLDQL